MAYDINDPDQKQADQADEAIQARKPARSSGRFAQGFGARSRSRTGLGQQAADAARLFWDDQPRELAPTQSNFGGGSAVGYAKEQPVDLTPPGYQPAHFIDMMGHRHDYLDKIGDPMDMSWLNDKYKKDAPAPSPSPAPAPATPPPPENRGTIEPTPTVRPAPDTDLDPTPVAPVARQVPMVSEPPVGIKSSIPPTTPLAIPRYVPTVSSPPVEIKPSIPATTPLDPTYRVGAPISGGWGQALPVERIPVTPLADPGPNVVSVPSAPARVITPGMGFQTTSDVNAKENIKPLASGDVDAFLQAMSRRKA